MTKIVLHARKGLKKGIKRNLKPFLDVERIMVYCQLNRHVLICPECPPHTRQHDIDEDKSAHDN